MKPWRLLGQIIDSGNVAHLEAFLELLAPSDTPYTINRLDEDRQTRMLSMARPGLAAQLIEHLNDSHAADLIEELAPQGAAAIVDELDSDDQADILGELDRDEAEAILTHMDPQEAADARQLVGYEPDTAGGVMITEFLSYHMNQSVSDVLEDLRNHVEEYADYDVQYVYATDDQGVLRGLIKIRDVVLTSGNQPLRSIMNPSPTLVGVNDSIDHLEDIFDRYAFNAIPVINPQRDLVGVVRRAAVEEAHSERAERDLMRVSGIIAGEELRSMPLASRSLRRLAYLVPNILLMILSISVIAAFEDLVLKDVIALAIFLPLVAGVSGSAGNQAVAVSIRELSLGVAKSTDTLRVLVKELQVGVVNGLVVGVIVFVIAYAMRGDFYLAMVIGCALPATVIVSVTLGGTVPLILHRLRVDPAMASGPIITTLIDFFGFFSVLGLAWLMIDYLNG